MEKIALYRKNNGQILLIKRKKNWDLIGEVYLNSDDFLKNDCYKREIFYSKKGENTEHIVCETFCGGWLRL